MKNEHIFGKNLRYSEYSSKDGGYTVYAVYGEDPNCDMGGSHHNPFLGNVEGVFKEVLEYAANNMSMFYQWGGGGYIVPLKNLQESSKPLVVNKQKKLKLERKKKLEQLMRVNIDELIVNVDTMTKEEIKLALNEIKNSI